MAFGWGEVDELLEGWEAEEVALVAMDRAVDGIVVEFEVLEVVET